MPWRTPSTKYTSRLYSEEAHHEDSQDIQARSTAGGAACPRRFRFDGDEVAIKRTASGGVLLMPKTMTFEQISAILDQFRGRLFDGNPPCRSGTGDDLGARYRHRWAFDQSPRAALRTSSAGSPVARPARCDCPPSHWSRLDTVLRQEMSAPSGRKPWRIFSICFKSTDFPASAANDYADIRVALERKGSKIGSYDLLIAAHARHIGSTIVTNNEREFRRVPGLSVQELAQAVSQISLDRKLHFGEVLPHYYGYEPAHRRSVGSAISDYSAPTMSFTLRARM